MSLNLEQLNEAELDDFIQFLDGVYENSPWIARRAAAERPFVSIAHLKYSLAQVVRLAGNDEQLALIRLHPEPKLALGERYLARFGIPFVLAIGGPRGTGLAAADVIATIERRLDNHPEFEQAEALRNLNRIAELRLNQSFDYSPVQGNIAWDWAEQLAEFTDPGYEESGQLTVTYLTDAHRACAQRLAGWMREECGFDSVEIDAVGNVVGVYHGDDAGCGRLLTGSHYDTVRNGGKYDGRLGIFVPMICVQSLFRQGRRLRFGIEVVAFAEEEGQRYMATFLGSSALLGQFDKGWLEQIDADGVSMREAILHAGLAVEAISAIKRNPRDYLGFVEVHIEQGPVLSDLNLPLGVVTSINGSARFVGEISGMASHAGTTPMGTRRDAATGVAELALYVERRGSAQPELVATMGVLEVPNGSVNVIPGKCRFSLDIRATTDNVRDNCVTDIQAELAAICARRGLSFSLEASMQVAAAPSSPEWQIRWENAVQGVGVPVFRMSSGAGHDAMKLHNVMPQAMLFVRGENAGVSHNPLESTNSDDMQLLIEAFSGLLRDLE